VEAQEAPESSKKRRGLSREEKNLQREGDERKILKEKEEKEERDKEKDSFLKSN